MSKLQAAQDVLDAQALATTGEDLASSLLSAVGLIYAKLPDYLAAKAKMTDPTDIEIAEARITAAMQPVFDELDTPKWTDEEKQFVVDRMQEIINHINPPVE